MRRAGVSKPWWPWQRRFMEAGVGGLLHDKTRKPGKAPVPGPVMAQLVERTLGDPPGETTHWTSRAMAGAMGLAISTVQKIWRAHGLAPHRLRTFKLSRDPQFAAKVLEPPFPRRDQRDCLHFASAGRRQAGGLLSRRQTIEWRTGATIPSGSCGCADIPSRDTSCFSLSP
jgi:hypothetical protein